MNFDYTISVGNLLTIGVLVISFLAFIIRRSNDMGRLMENLQNNAKATEEANAESKRRFELNGAKFDALKLELQHHNEHGGTYAQMRFGSFDTRIADLDMRVRALELSMGQLGAISTNIEWIKQSLNELKLAVSDGRKENDDR